MIDLDLAKERIIAEVDRRADTLIEASHSIHGRPELKFEERHAHDVLTAILEDEHLAPERGAFGLDTAFAARAGRSGPTVAVLCEYDALPALGHACGHNVIAAAGLGAGLAAAGLAEEMGGRVLILGTPAEEGGGGKILMADQGAFDGVDAAMMVHPAGLDLRSMDAIAIQTCLIEYRGRAAHAAAAPQQGRNALDAAVLGYLNVAALRQHIDPGERIHGIFLRAGDAANVVPASTTAEWYVRSPTAVRLEPLKERVAACLQAGATAAGCTMELTWKDPSYAELVDNDPFADLYATNSARRGRDV
ncbi:MAG: amidohydrolase, partial [Acidimicrobiales bacterium]